MNQVFRSARHPAVNQIPIEDAASAVADADDLEAFGKKIVYDGNSCSLWIDCDGFWKLLLDSFFLIL